MPPNNGRLWLTALLSAYIVGVLLEVWQRIRDVEFIGRSIPRWQYGVNVLRGDC